MCVCVCRFFDTRARFNRRSFPGSFTTGAAFRRFVVTSRTYTRNIVRFRRFDDNRRSALSPRMFFRWSNFDHSITVIRKRIPYSTFAKSRSARFGKTVSARVPDFGTRVECGGEGKGFPMHRVPSVLNTRVTGWLPNDTNGYNTAKS